MKVSIWLVLIAFVIGLIAGLSAGRRPLVEVVTQTTEYTHKGVIGDEWWSANVQPLTVDDYDEDDMTHTCGDCGEKLQIVRPGKYQCPNCE
jgi:hypothetical protein